ncbi:LAFA_0D14928g1_1 [Lachancea sp. 'fantastica']|nr:LAFA_0D14928g1_1 [Lachancea sp. 'fantastica']
MTKFDRKSTTDDGVGLDQLIAERSRLITELYCLSRIQDFLQITNEKELTTQINEFLDIHDIRKGYRFDRNTLPKFSQVDPPLERKLLKSRSSTPVESSKRDKEQVKHEKEDHKKAFEDQKKASREIKEIAGHEEPSINNHLPLRASDETAEGIEEASIVTAGGKRAREDDTTEASEPQRPANNVQESSQAVTVHEGHGDAKRQKTSSSARGRSTEHRVSEVKRINPLIREIMHNQPEKKALFHEQNINSKESVYLIMNDTIPSLIPQAVSLSELKFNSQTLPLVKLIPTAHKVLTSEIMTTALNECRIAVVSSRIEELRRQGLWSLRQPKKPLDPWEKAKDTESHHGHLLREAKWMHYDFYEHTKYKRAVCLTIAQGVMDFWNYGRVCCVKTAPTKHLEPIKNETESEPEISPVAEPEQAHESSELESNSTQNDKTIPNDENTEVANTVDTIDIALLLKRPDPLDEIKALKLPQTDEESYVREKKTKSPFKLHVSTDEFNYIEKKVIDNLRLFSGVFDLDGESTAAPVVPFEPISKATVLLDDNHFSKLVERQIIDEEPSLVPFSKRRGMFYGNRRSHYLRPPIAPSLRYLKYRTPTIWLPQDDQELVRNINTYAYNWDLISAHMSSRPTTSYCSNIERRTPWQCFERFIQLNEKFQFIDMKGPRAHNAQVWLIEAHKLQQQQKRRISPLGIGEESIQRGHKRLRWASMFEAMRKCIKKRENAPRPNPTQPRKPLDCKNTTVPTPAEMSQLKAQRDDALRRDIQIRRIAKQKLQAAALTQGLPTGGHTRALPHSSPPSGQRRAVNNGTGITRGVSAESGVKVTTQTPNKMQVKQYPRSSNSQFKGIPIEQQREQKVQNSAENKYSTEPKGEKIHSPTPQEILQQLQRGK